MMGRQYNDQGHLFYEFCLDEAVPDDHLVRKIDAVLNLSWVHAELAPHYPTLGRPSVDPVLMNHTRAGSCARLFLPSCCRASRLM